MSIIYAPGVTSKSIDITIVDDMGIEVTGLVAATFPALTYSVAGANADVLFSTTAAFSDLAALTTAFSACGIKERGNGVYRVDVPDTAWASAGKVKIRGGSSGKRVIEEVIDVSYPQVDARQWLGGTIPAVTTTGVPKVDLFAILGTTLTETAGYLAGAFKKFFNIQTPTLTTGGTDQTGDGYGVVNSGTFGNAQLVRSTTPANTLTVDSGHATTFNNTSIATVTTLSNLPAVPTDWLTAAGVKADAVTKIQSGLATPTNITAGTITTVTTLTNLPSIPAGWLTATGIAAAALNGKGDWLLPAGTLAHVTLVDTTTTNTDMRGTDNALLASGYTAPHNSNIDAIYGKLPAGNIADEALVIAATDTIIGHLSDGTITLTSAYDAAKTALQSGGDVNAATVGGNVLVQTAGKLWTLDGDGNALATASSIGDLGGWATPTNVADARDAILAVGGTGPWTTGGGGSAPTTEEIWTYASRSLTISGPVTIISPVNITGDVLELIAGDAYLTTIGNQVKMYIPSANLLPIMLPDGTTVALKIRQQSNGSVWKFAGAITVDGATKTVTFDMAAADTAALPTGRGGDVRFQVEFLVGGDPTKVVTASRGFANVMTRIPDPS